jgi:glycosyltransferase involved in cell wall biosynthesis
VVCATIAYEPSWKWFAPVFDQVRWEFFGAQPSVWLERSIFRPSLASWRSCWHAARAARRGRAAMFFSHDARITFRCAQAIRVQQARLPHVAWGFNFTTLPRGPLRRLMAAAFKRVDRFIVYSTMEKEVYTDYFGIDPRRVDVVLWGVGHPQVEPKGMPLETGDYICALGGNARDYRTLFAAMARLPEIPLVAVLRPENIAGLTIPANIRLHFNIPSGWANNILAHSRFMVLPLSAQDVPCGHVTLVAAMHLRKAMIISRSMGVSDYVQDGVNSLCVPVGDADALAQRIGELWNNRRLADELADAGHAFALRNCSEDSIKSHLKKVLLDYGLPA